MSKSTVVRPGAPAVIPPTLSMSVDLARSIDGGYEPRRVCVSVHLPEAPSPEELRLVEQRLRHLASAESVAWRRWEWAPAGERGQVITVRGVGEETRATLSWLKSLSRGEPAVRVIARMDVVPVHRSLALPPGVTDADWARGPSGLWVARAARQDGRVVLIRRE